MCVCVSIKSYSFIKKKGERKTESEKKGFDLLFIVCCYLLEVVRGVNRVNGCARLMLPKV